MHVNGPLDAGADDPRLMSRALGVLLVAASLITIFGISIARPENASRAGIYAVALTALTLGIGALADAQHARRWTAHTLFASGTALICAGTFFAGAPTGLYAFMLVWLAIVAASFFSPRALAAHIAWIAVASGLVVATLPTPSGPPPSGPPPFARWAIGCVLLSIAAAVMGRIAAGRRATEERLRAEIAERERLQRELEHLADHDPLTGLANRRRLEQDLARELARARRDDTPLSLVALDLDDLKRHNDAFGHAAGDRLLKHVAGTWAGALRASDLIARTGGDEFVILLPDCSLAMAERLMDRLRADVAASSRCSAGAACWDGSETADELQDRADLAMYDAKARGRADISAYRAG